MVSTDRIEVDASKTEAIRNWETPNTMKGVQWFLGFCNFYRGFIREYGRMAKPLSQLTSKDVPFVWTQDCKQGFMQLKESLTSAAVLRHYWADLRTKIETDASDRVVAGVLWQCFDGVWHPVAYYSKTISA